MLTLTIAAAALAAGYGLGRLQPLHRISDWANWQKYGRPTGLRRAAVWTVLSADNIGWLIVHPVQGARAWKHRNDPPPPRSPAVKVGNPDPAPARDPNWLANRNTNREDR